MTFYGHDSSRPLRVLLVEANAQEAAATREALYAIPDLWIEVIHCATLAEARAFLRMHNVGVVLMELELPNGRGMESLRAVRNTPQQSPIIIITGADSEADAIRAMDEEGAQNYIQKQYLKDPVIARRILIAAIARNRNKMREYEALRRMYDTGVASGAH